jgi:HK97 family phage portal protein
MPTLYPRLREAFKAFQMVFSSRGGLTSGGYAQTDARSGSYVLYGDIPAPIPGTAYNFRTSVGEMWRNASVMACAGWMQRNFAEAPLRVMRATPDGDDEPVKDHPLAQLLEHPNPVYSGDVLWQGAVLSYAVNGNAYWLTNVNGAGEVVELWYVPHTMLRPTWPENGTEFLTNYLYRVNGRDIPVPVERVIHFRFGFDLNNQRLGYSPLLSGLPEVDTLNEGAIYTASILRNKGVVGGILSNEDPNVTMTEEKAEKLRARYRAMFTGDGRGDLMVPTFKSSYSEVGKSPEELALDKILTMPQETVCALVGLNSMVVGLPSNDRTYANYGESLKAAVSNCIRPMKGLFACDLNHQLLPGFSGPRKKEYVDWDWSQVPAFQDELRAKWELGLDALDKGGITPNEFRSMVGYKALKPEQRAEIEAYQAMRAARRGGGGGPPGLEPAAGGSGPESAGDRAANGAGARNERAAVGVNGH